MHHFIYKTTNSVNGKYYKGMHGTDVLDDGYIGSGVILNNAIKKYGVKCFTCEIVQHAAIGEEPVGWIESSEWRKMNRRKSDTMKT